MHTYIPVHAYTHTDVYIHAISIVCIHTYLHIINYLFVFCLTGSCVAMGYVGCCNPQDSTSCLGSGNTCYCDELCYEFNDCCDDVTQIGCIGMISIEIQFVQNNNDYYYRL